MDREESRLAVAVWISDVGARCASNLSREEIDARAGDYATGLLDLPGSVFCEDAREAAAREFDYFPPYAKLRKFLAQWADDHKPRIQPPGEDDPTLTTEDRVGWIDLWNRRRADHFVNFGHGSERQRMIVNLDMMRRIAPRAFRYVVHTDAEAASIAVQRHWPVDDRRPDPRERSEEEREQAAEAAREAVKELGVPRAQRTPPPTTEPTRLADVQPYLAKIQARFEAERGRKMGALSSEQLREAYEKQPLARDPRESVNGKTESADSPSPSNVTPFRPRQPDPPPPAEPAPAPDLWVPPWEREPA